MLSRNDTRGAPCDADELARARLKLGFTPAKRHDGVPCLNYTTPNGGGGNCFVAVGASKGGWALEAESVTSNHDVVFYGATIRAAARVRIGNVKSLKTGRYSTRYRVRFFAGLVPRRALRVKPNNIVALDRRGRLLGRQHYNDGNGGFGRCDGSWDREHCTSGPLLVGEQARQLVFVLREVAADHVE